VSLRGYKLNYFWILKLLSGQNISFYICGLTTLSSLTAFVFVPSVFGENIPTAEFGMISADTSCWEIERKEPNF
jgi:hypothetical protein